MVVLMSVEPIVALPRVWLPPPEPVEVDPRVLRAMSYPVLGQFDPEFTTIMNETMGMLRELFAKKEMTTATVDLNEAAREVLAQVSAGLHRDQVIVRRDLAEDLPLVTGDPVQLQQVISNLVRNASDAMANVQDHPRQLVVRTAQDGGDSVRLDVQDAGTGLDPKLVEKLFEPFYTTKSEGMGVGLFVSRSIIERHNGRLWASPNEGPGATFSFVLPIAVDATAPQHSR